MSNKKQFLISVFLVVTLLIACFFREKLALLLKESLARTSLESSFAWPYAMTLIIIPLLSALFITIVFFIFMDYKNLCFKFKLNYFIFGSLILFFYFLPLVPGSKVNFYFFFILEVSFLNCFVISGIGWALFLKAFFHYHGSEKIESKIK